MAAYTGYRTLYEYLKWVDIPDGEHTLILEANDENVNIDIEMYNLYDDVVYDEVDSLGSDTPDKRMLVLKYHGNLTIEEGAVFRPKVRKKGMLVWVDGTLENNGTISMTARGAIAEGQNVYMYENKDGTFEYVPAIGGSGGQGYTLSKGIHSGQRGRKGEYGVGRQTGGGGSGAGRQYESAVTIGAGGRGTSYSGGSGSGAGATDRGTSVNVPDASNIGGAGSAGNSGDGNKWPRATTGGQGNPSGRHDLWRIPTGATVSYEQGTGGLLIIYSRVLLNYGLIESRGVKSQIINDIDLPDYTLSTGGSSGGGSVNIFMGSEGEVGVVDASGGIHMGRPFPSGGSFHGGDGGKGTVTITKINYFLIKSLIKSLNKYYTYNKNEGLIKLDIEELSKSDFIEYGFMINLVDNIGEILSTLDEPKLLMNVVAKPQIKVTHKPNPQLILPTGDIVLNMLDKIHDFTITTNKNNGGDIKIICSVDSGETWLTFNTTTEEFEEIDVEDLEEIKAYGISPDDFNSIGEKWNDIVTNSKVRFGYYLEIEDMNGIAEVDKLEIEMDMHGRWKKAKHGEDYDYEYDNEHIYVSFFKDGSYKVNYQG